MFSVQDHGRANKHDLASVLDIKVRIVGRIVRRSVLAIRGILVM